MTFALIVVSVLGALSAIGCIVAFGRGGLGKAEARDDDAAAPRDFDSWLLP